MKKIILSMILCAVAFVAKAQIESVDFKSNFRSDFGVGAGITVDLNNDFEFSPSANLYFCDCGTHIDFEADFHYNIDLGKNFTLYPIAGGVLCYTNLKDNHVCVHHPRNPHDDKYYDGKANLGVNIGCGLKYDFSKKCAGFMDIKYQWINEDDHAYDDTYVSLGVKIAI